MTFDAFILILQIVIFFMAGIFFLNCAVLLFSVSQIIMQKNFSFKQKIESVSLLLVLLLFNPLSFSYKTFKIKKTQKTS